MTILLVDTSHWQGAMNWQTAKDKGVKGAIIKASEGTTWRDDQFKRSVEECKRLGIAWGAYHYFYPKLNALQQAQNFLAAMSGLKPDLGIWGDFEEPEATLDVQALAHTFMDEIKKSYSAGMYTSPGYAKYTLKSASWMKEFPLWLAHYGVTSPTIPAPWTECVIWQYSSSGTGYGSDGNIDLNKFMRPDSEWEAFSGQTPVVEPPVVEPPAPSVVPFTAEDKAHLDLMYLYFKEQHPTSFTPE